MRIPERRFPSVALRRDARRSIRSGEMILPNMIIAGSPRCGTSALFRYLADHPEVLASKKKETQYFVDRSSVLFNQRANFANHKLEGYSAWFPQPSPHAPPPVVVMEATPAYMYQEMALQKLPGIPSKPTFLFMLRRPSRQLYSVYAHSKNQAGNLRHDVAFEEFVYGSTRLSRSPNEFHRHSREFAVYANYLTKWREACGSERMVVMLYEDMDHNPGDFMRRLAVRLGVAPEFYETYPFGVKNANVAIRNRWLHKVTRGLAGNFGDGELRRTVRWVYRSLNTGPKEVMAQRDREILARLDEQFAEANQRLAEQFGLDLSWWQAG
jgi:hypothetical protein